MAVYPNLEHPWAHLISLGLLRFVLELKDTRQCNFEGYLSNQHFEKRSFTHINMLAWPIVLIHGPLR